MIPLKFKRMEIRKPRYDPHPEKSTTNNSEWRQGLFLIFEDYSGNEFDYMPQWEELSTLPRMKELIEDINKNLASEKKRSETP